LKVPPRFCPVMWGIIHAYRMAGTYLSAWVLYEGVGLQRGDPLPNLRGWGSPSRAPIRGPLNPRRAGARAHPHGPVLVVAPIGAAADEVARATSGDDGTTAAMKAQLHWVFHFGFPSTALGYTCHHLFDPANCVFSARRRVRPGKRCFRPAIKHENRQGQFIPVTSGRTASTPNVWRFTTAVIIGDDGSMAQAPRRPAIRHEVRSDAAVLAESRRPLIGARKPN